MRSLAQCYTVDLKEIEKKMFHLLLALPALIICAVFITIAIILIGMVITALISGIVLLLTGAHLSKGTRHKVAGGVCVGIGVVILLLVITFAGAIAGYAMNIFG